MIAVLLLTALQAKHSRNVPPPRMNAIYFAQKWHARDWTTGKLYPIVPEDFATAANVLSVTGTYAEDDNLSRTFRPFWVGTTKDNQRIVFSRNLTVPGEPQSCS